MYSRLVALLLGAALATPSVGSAQVPLASSRNDPTGHLTLHADPSLLPAGAPRPAPSPAARAAAELNAQKFQAPGTLIGSSGRLLDGAQPQTLTFGSDATVKWKFKPGARINALAAELGSPEVDRLKSEREAVLARKRELEQAVRGLDAEVQRLNALLLEAIQNAPAK